MAVRELGMVYLSQLANEATDYLVESVPYEVAGVKAVDLGLGVLGALTAMDMVPVRGDVATAVEIVGLGRLAKATMDIIKGATAPAPTAGVRPLTVRPTALRVTPSASTSTEYQPAGL